MSFDIHIADHLRVVEIEAGHRVIGLRLFRFLLDRQNFSAGVHLEDAITLRIRHDIAEDGGAVPPCRRFGHEFGQAMAVENIVAEDQGDIVGADEIAAYDKGVGKPARPLLYRVGERQTELRAVAQ